MAEIMQFAWNIVKQNLECIFSGDSSKCKQLPMENTIKIKINDETFMEIKGSIDVVKEDNIQNIQLFTNQEDTIKHYNHLQIDSSLSNGIDGIDNHVLVTTNNNRNFEVVDNVINEDEPLKKRSRIDNDHDETLNNIISDKSTHSNENSSPVMKQENVKESEDVFTTADYVQISNNNHNERDDLPVIKKDVILEQMEVVEEQQQLIQPIEINEEISRIDKPVRSLVLESSLKAVEFLQNALRSKDSNHLSFNDPFKDDLPEVIAIDKLECLVVMLRDPATQIILRSFLADRICILCRHYAIDSKAVKANNIIINYPQLPHEDKLCLHVLQLCQLYVLDSNKETDAVNRILPVNNCILRVFVPYLMAQVTTTFTETENNDNNNSNDNKTKSNLLVNAGNIIQKMLADYFPLYGDSYDQHSIKLIEFLEYIFKRLIEASNCLN